MTTTTPTFPLRTPAQIIERIDEAKNDFFNFTAEVLLPYLTFEQAKPLLKDDAKADDWGDVKPLDREAVLADMANYMAFAWGKVEDHRGISAGRSVDKMTAWMWLLGDDEGVQGIEATSYAQYGAPKLAYVCERYGFAIPDGSWATNMIAGEKCSPDCENGCGQ